MVLFQTNNRNFLLALIVVIGTGVVGPLFLGLSLGILIQILQYLLIWGFIIVVVSYLVHYAPMRGELQLKRFAIYVGFSLTPYLVYNIVKPLLEGTLARHLDGVWDLEVIRQSTESWAFHASVFLYSALPVITIVAVIVFASLSMHQVYGVATEKALLIAIPIVLLAVFLSTVLQQGLLLLF
jgi:hypothetical protein